jgi:hypothetical protein
MTLTLSTCVPGRRLVLDELIDLREGKVALALADEQDDHRSRPIA